MVREVRFHSIFGYTTSSARDGERLTVTFRVNCKDNLPEEIKCKMASNVLDDVIYPEIIRLVNQGKLPIDFKVWKAHLLMYGDESQNEILLNDEVRFTGQVLFEEGRTISEGHPVAQDDIKAILGLYPSTKCPPNAAHVMLVKLNNKWYYAADLIYDKDRVKRRFETAKDFITVSNFCIENKL